jgi:hypothetical protein
MSHYDAEAERLRDAAVTATRGVAAAVKQAQEARVEVGLSGDLIPVMGAIAGLILACEALQAAGKQAETELRTTLAKSMSLGATTVRTESLTISLKEGARRVVLTGTVPPEFLIPQEPKPDIKAIGDTLRKGEALDWATLSNGGEQSLQIRVREEVS